MMRIVWPLFMLFIAIISVGMQLDRQSRIDADLSTEVPQPFRSFALANLTADQLQGGDLATSLEAARQLVRQRPVDAAHVRMLAQVQLAEAPDGSGADTLQIAGKLGWRDGGTQFGMLQMAMATGDDAEAARRMAAIWALSTNRDDLAKLAPLVLTRKGAQAEFARLMDASPRWRAKVIREAPLILPPELARGIVTPQ